MAWPAGTSIEFSSILMTVIPGTSGNTWIGNIDVVVTLSTGESLSINREFDIPAGIVSAIQAKATALAAAEGTTLTWP